VYLAAAAKGDAAAATAAHTLGSGVPFTANLKAVTVLSTDTIQMDLWTPQIDWLETLYASGRFFMRAPSTIADKTKCTSAGVGTGPFTFSSVTPELVKVTRNASYWRKDKNGTQLPYLKSITFRYIEQATQRVNGLKSSSLDAAQFTSAGEVKQIVSVKETKNLGVIDSADTFFPTFWLNQAIEPFNNKNARLAFAHAWDVESYYKLRNCFKGKCVGAIPTSIVGPKNVMYNKAGFLKFDTKKSKSFQEAYTKDTGKKLTVQLVATTSADSKANAQAAKTILKKAGIESTLLVEDGATQVANAFPGPTQVAAGKFNPYQAYPVLLFEGEGTGFILPFLSPNVFKEPGNDFLKVVPTFIAFGVGLNVTRHTDPALSGLVWDAKQDTTAARAVKLKAVTKYVQENAVVVPTPTLSYHFAFNQKLKGYDKFTLAAGGAGIPMTNAGVTWTGVYIQK
jgi:ABC-type transport system substrate-binding protein